MMGLRGARGQRRVESVGPAVYHALDYQDPIPGSRRPVRGRLSIGHHGCHGGSRGYLPPGTARIARCAVIVVGAIAVAAAIAAELEKGPLATKCSPPAWKPESRASEGRCTATASVTLAEMSACRMEALGRPQPTASHACDLAMSTTDQSMDFARALAASMCPSATTAMRSLNERF